VADARDGALEGEVGSAEAQTVEERDRPRAHGDDVAQDSADAGGCALERLDRRRVIVALDLERDRLALAEIDDARVLARPLEDARAVARKALQQERRMLVTAMLAPEQREHGQLELVRLATEQRLDARELAVREAERPVEGLLAGCRERAQRSTQP
jgi:hypothetical protein